MFCICVDCVASNICVCFKIRSTRKDRIATVRCPLVPDFSGTVPEIRLILSQVLSSLFIFLLHSVLSSQMGIFLDLVSNFSNKEVATVLRMEQ